MSQRKRVDRWEQFNYLVDVVCPQFKSATYSMVLLACFRHGRGLGYFRVSTSRIAKSALTSKRWGQRVLDDFEEYGLIELIEPEKGTIPRTYRIRFFYDENAIRIDCKIPPRGELQTTPTARKQKR